MLVRFYFINLLLQRGNTRSSLIIENITVILARVHSKVAAEHMHEYLSKSQSKSDCLIRNQKVGSSQDLALSKSARLSIAKVVNEDKLKTIGFLPESYKD
jgi:hypothetical protein